jgi:hypothetical protein
VKVNATAVTAVTGTTTDVNTLDAAVDLDTIDLATNYSITLDAGQTATVTEVNNWDTRNGTGEITAVISNGAASDLIQLTGTHAYTITLTESTVSAVNLNTINSKTSLNITAASLTTVTADASNAGLQAVIDAFTAGAAAGLDGTQNVVISGDFTNALNYALLGTINGLTSGTITLNDTDGTAIIDETDLLNILSAGAQFDVGDTNIRVEGDFGTSFDADISETYAAGIDVIDETTGDNAYTITSAQATEAITANQATATFRFADNDLVTLADNFNALFTFDVSDLAAAGVDRIDEVGGDNVYEITVAQLNEAYAGNVTFADRVIINDTTAKNTFNTAQFEGTMVVRVDTGGDTVTFGFDDVNADGLFTSGTDKFLSANANGVDVITFAEGDVLDISAFNLGSQALNTDTFRADTAKVGNGEYAIVQGTFNAGTGEFTYTTTGANAVLVLWDSDVTSGSVSQSGVVVLGVTSLDIGTELLVTPVV